MTKIERKNVTDGGGDLGGALWGTVEVTALARFGPTPKIVRAHDMGNAKVHNMWPNMTSCHSRLAQPALRAALRTCCVVWCQCVVHGSSAICGASHISFRQAVANT